MKYLVILSSIFSPLLPHPQGSPPLSANQRQGLPNRVNTPRTRWAKLFWPQTDLHRRLTNTPNYTHEAKVCPIKNQLYSLNTPNYVCEQMLAQLRTGFRFIFSSHDWLQLVWYAPAMKCSGGEKEITLMAHNHFVKGTFHARTIEVPSMAVKTKERTVKNIMLEKKL